MFQNTIRKYWTILFVAGVFSSAIAFLQFTPFSVASSSNNGGNFVFVANVLEAWGGGDGCCGGDGPDRNGREKEPPPPTIVFKPKPSCVISAYPPSIKKGESSTLIWSSSNATSAFINQGIGAVAVSGTRAVSPNVTKTYILTVEGPGGTANCQTTITVTEPPAKKPSCVISAYPSSIKKGDSSTLAWSSNNATSAVINRGIGSVALNGSMSVSPLVTTTYTMTVTGSGGTANCQTTIYVEPKELPSCTIFASPSFVQYGGSSTLIWNSQNATSASINQGIGSVAVNGSHVVTGLQTTHIYTLTVSGSGGTANCYTTVTVEQHQTPSCAINANPSSVQYGGSSTLTWSSQNATSATLSSIGSVSTNGSQTVSNIYVTTTYTLTVAGPGGTANCQTTVHTTQVPSVPSCTIYANPTSVQQGGTSYISWTSSNATSAMLSNVGSVGVSGSQTVYPYTTTTYTLTVYGSQGASAQCQTTVYVTSIPIHQPPSCWITLTPQYGHGSYQYNRPSTLSWGSTNAISAYISPSVGSVGTSGSQTVYPSGNQVYTMNVTGAQGTSAICQTQQAYVPPPVYPPYVSLTQIPYTGLDFGLTGDILYWFSILSFVLAGGYLAVYYLPVFARLKARVPAPVMEAPIAFARTVAAAVPFAPGVFSSAAPRWMTQDSMTLMRSENGSAPRIVITRN